MTRWPRSRSTSTWPPQHVRFASYQDLTSFPEIREDLAVIVADTVTAAQVLDVVREAGGALLAGAEVFDVYRDEQRIGAGNVSLALRAALPRARPHAHRRGGGHPAAQDRRRADLTAGGEGP